MEIYQKPVVEWRIQPGFCESHDLGRLSMLPLLTDATENPKLEAQMRCFYVHV